MTPARRGCRGRGSAAPGEGGANTAVPQPLQGEQSARSKECGLLEAMVGYHRGDASPGCSPCGPLRPRGLEPGAQAESQLGRSGSASAGDQGSGKEAGPLCFPVRRRMDQLNVAEARLAGAVVCLCMCVCVLVCECENAPKASPTRTAHKHGAATGRADKSLSGLST